MAPPENSSGKRGGKIIPFPRAPISLGDDPPRADPLSEIPPEGVDSAWSEELRRLAEEPQTSPLELILDRPAAGPLLDFLEATGLDALVRVEESGDHASIRVQRPTVSRLVVWQALDLGLDFSVKTLG